MPKAVKMKLLSVLVLAICMVALYLSLGLSATFQWGAIALTVAGCVFTYINC